MSFGTPVVGTTAYSAAAGTSVAPTYPASIVATDQLVMIIGMKPSTANSGSVTTPSGWTLRETLTGAGGYGATLGADTGNTNLWIFTKDTVTAGLSGTVTVTIATNNVSWANITRVPTAGGTITYGSADGQRTTTPTSPLSVALTDGATATAFQAGDFAIWAMCIPTDVTTPAQFSAHTITSSGITFNATAELIEPDSTTGNDIGGYVAYVTVNTGSGGGAPTVGATLAGTLTNVRGPIALLRMRETLAAITGDLAATESGSDTFAATGDVVVKGSLSATETGSDTFAATGTVGDAAITGTMAATETGSDTFTSTGDVIVKGSLAATESGSDTFASTGDVVVKGSLAATESGPDTFASTGDVIVKGSLAATETGSDTFAATGTVGGGSAITGTMAATETGSDTFAASGVVKVAGQMAATESGQDVAGTYVLDGYVEPGYYLEPWTGTVLVRGAMAASESGSDIFHATGTTNPTPEPTQRGGGIDPRWTKKERKQRDQEIEQERKERAQLRRLIEQAIDPVEEGETVKVVTTADKKAVVISAPSRPAVAIPAIKFDARQVSAEIGKVLAAANLEAKRVRDAESRRMAEEAQRVAVENMRIRMKRRREEELLLLM